MADKKMYEISKGDLIATPKPQLTRTYKPVEHERLMDLTLNAIVKAGFSVDSEVYTAARNGNQANARYKISNLYDNEMQLQVGWQNSYDKSLSLKYALGANIFICTNGAVVGDMGNFKKKHVGQVQTFTPQAITEYIMQAGDTFSRLQSDRDKMKNIELTKRTTAELLGRMFVEEQLVTSTQLNIIKRELEKPTHDYKAEGSMWELYNFTTFSFKEIHPSDYLDAHIKLHDFVVNEFGLLEKKEAVENELVLVN